MRIAVIPANHPVGRFAVRMCGAVVLAAFAALGEPALAASNGEPVSLNFKDADIDTVIGAFGVLLDRTFIIDPRVRGKLTLETPGPVTPAQAYKLLLASLRLQGFTIVASGRIAKVVPEAEAKLQDGPVGRGKPSEDGDQIVTQVFRLNYESATNMVPVLRPLIAPNNTISAYPNNNSLVITDYAANLQRIGRIIATLDNPGSSDVAVLPVRYGIASDLAVMLTRLLDDTQRAGQGAQVDAGQRAVVIADPNSNSIMLRAASAAKISLAKSLLDRLDVPSKAPGNIRVVYLRNAQATQLAKTLQAVLSGNASGGASNLVDRTNRATSVLAQNNPNGGTVLGATQQPLANNGADNQLVTITAGDATIAADPTTNSLIITAPDAVYRNLRAVIDKLDMRRAQVYIESLIVEVSAEKAAEFGIQWQLLDVTNGSTRGIGGTNFTNSTGGGSILSAAQNPASLGTGINIGVVSGTTTIPGVTGEILNLPLLARALESNADANILATPNLLTLDNEEARIIIGQNVPFVTGQYAATGANAATVNPFQTIERRDVGTTLRVRPQVSESGSVKLEIFQEVSSVQAATIAADIITNRRAIETNVLVDDGQIVVLGGLIEERVEGGVQKVPVLGDIPVLGNLFRYDSRNRKKTNLLVFLRPVILRDAADAYRVTSNRYDYIRDVRSDASLREHWALPKMPATPMAPMPAAPQPTVRDDNGEAQPAPPAPAGSLSPGVDDFIDLRGRERAAPESSGMSRSSVYERSAASAPAEPPATRGARREPDRRGPSGGPAGAGLYLN
ncbi:MAG: type II secretion system secretin GspD [Burkholderiaceae bacterium]